MEYGDYDITKPRSQGKMSNVQLFTLVFGVLVTIGIGIVFLFNPNDSYDSRSIAREDERTVKYESPSMANVPPGYATVGKDFSFSLRVVDGDTEYDDIDVYLEQGPGWLNMDGFTLYGTPTEAEGTPQKVVVVLSDGVYQIRETFYMVVVESNESSNVTEENGE